ncbi:MAG: prephenate dehydrogenase [Planctomycetota bacterium]|jgi:prephenate dehydrogenase
MIARLAIIGVGLIGGSLSLALKQANQVKEVVGYGRNRQNLEKGVELGVIDRFETSISDCVAGADIVVVAVPLGAMSAVFSELARVVTADMVITDVGSAKGSVVEIARASLGDRFAQFVPGHPIAGTENSGVEAAFASLYQGRKVILTPLDETSPQAIELISTMWKDCKASVEFLAITHHDKVLAATSHLPHMLAYTLVHHLSALNEHEEIFRYAAGGFRDFSRIASSDPVMWRDVCISNGDALVDLIEQYQRELTLVADAIRNKDADCLLELFGRAKTERDSLIGNC